MRSRTNYIMTKEEVYGYSESWLSTALRLDCKGRKCTTSVLFRILLIAAGRVVSVFAACRDLADAPCSRTVYDALLASLPDIQELEKRLNRSLWPASWASGSSRQNRARRSSRSQAR